MPQVSETVLAPELEGGQWIQHGPVILKDLRDKAVVLVDFWDYTCVNCIRTLPYVVGWNRRYAGSGLVIVGVHAPEFSFRARRISCRGSGGALRPRIPDRVRQRIRNLARVLEQVLAGEISHRCARDAFATTTSAKARTRRASSIFRALQGTESRASSLPPPMEPVRDSDRPGAVCYRVTPELYLGHARGNSAIPKASLATEPHDYRDPGRIWRACSYLDGRWRVEQESARAEAVGAAISAPLHRAAR